MTDVKLTQSLSRVDEAASSGINYIAGPFSVFQTRVGLGETSSCALDSNRSPAGDSATSQLTMSPTEPLPSFPGPSETSSQHFSPDGESSTASNVETVREVDGGEILSSFESDEEGNLHPKPFTKRGLHQSMC